MYIWLSLLIPIFAIIILYIFFSKKIAWWESSLLFLIILGFIAIMKYSTEVSQTSDSEYIQDYIVRVEYYEDWNEEVPCRHPVYCTRYNSCCRTDSKGECEGCTETYQCGWQHAYDVDYHPEHWIMYTSTGRSYGISRNEWNRLMKQFEATPIFKDLRRDYHDNDGDMYYFLWNKVVESVEYTTIENNYENRVQASHSVYNYPEVDTSYIKFYDLKDYPSINKLVIPALLGDNNKKVDKYINQSNALYASKKQAKVFFLIFKKQPIDASFYQEQYWKGGNKNEINICIGVDSDMNIKWCKVFSWTKEEIVKIDIRDYINTQQKLTDSTYHNIINYSNNIIINKFKRREFKEFSYLTVEPTMSAIIWTFVISFILTIGMCVFAVMNDIDSDGIKYRY